MLELNKELKWQICAEVEIKGKKKKNIFKRTEENWIMERLEEFTDADVTALRICLFMGRKVKVADGEILLFFRNQPLGKVGPGVTITNNPQLCQILEELVML